MVDGKKVLVKTGLEMARAMRIRMDRKGEANMLVLGRTKSWQGGHIEMCCASVLPSMGYSLGVCWLYVFLCKAV